MLEHLIGAVNILQWRGPRVFGLLASALFFGRRGKGPLSPRHSYGPPRLAFANRRRQANRPRKSAPIEAKPPLKHPPPPASRCFRRWSTARRARGCRTTPYARPTRHGGGGFVTFLCSMLLWVGCWTEDSGVTKAYQAGGGVSFLCRVFYMECWTENSTNAGR
jgi:hypothetical protein